MTEHAPAARFDTYWDALGKSSRFHPANRFRYHLLRSIVPRYATAPSRVIDIGCGDGTLLSFIRELFPGAELVGCDVSAAQVDRNRQALPGVTFVAADASKPELVERLAAAGKLPADLVTSSEVIEHVLDDRAFLSNLARITAPGGTIFLTTQAGPRYRMDREVLGHLRHYQREHLERLVASAGLEVAEAFTCGFPILTFQKKAVDLAFSTVVRSVASGHDPGPLARLVMAAMYAGLKASPRILGGPQIVLVARTPR
jgi:2-polyprenyl-3-methyl-5-hydroxy-6-metoxy-1,4-benzoquinol methylase